VRARPAGRCRSGAPRVGSPPDDIHFGIIADRDQMDDVWSLVDGLHRALDDLEQALGTA
jgi:hypothetical protein